MIEGVFAAEAACAVAGAVAGFGIAWFLRKSREVPERVRIETQLAEARRSLEEQKKLLEESQVKLENAFKALASDALKSSNESFLKLAQETLEKHISQASGDLDARRKAVEDLVKPIGDQLKAYQEKSEALERERQTAYGGLTSLLTTMSATHEKLKKGTGALVSALRPPNVHRQGEQWTARPRVSA